jgi:hypothetical protein
VKWIKIEDECPENGEIVMCVDVYNPKLIAMGRYCFEDNTFEMTSDFWEEDTMVTHWMPKPKPPEVED